MDREKIEGIIEYHIQVAEDFLTEGKFKWIPQEDRLKQAKKWIDDTKEWIDILYPEVIAP